MNPEVVRRNLAEHLPFMATETILMDATARGGDRQELHERIRRHSMAAARRMKEEGAEADLLERIAADDAFGMSAGELEALVDPRRFVGRAPEQVARFLDEWVAPVLDPLRGPGEHGSGRPRSMSDAAPAPHRAQDLPLLHRGKVRDVYEVDDDTLLMVATDRVSAFDVVMGRPVPRKGEVLTLITAWWLAQLEGRIDHHLLAVDPDDIVARHPRLAASRAAWARRAMLVRRTRPVLVECVVRGYISGSAWKEYRQHGTLAGEPLPGGTAGVRAAGSAHLLAGHARRRRATTRTSPSPTPGRSWAPSWRGACATCPWRSTPSGATWPRERDIILADTKFEFGHDAERTSSSSSTRS